MCVCFSSGKSLPAAAKPPLPALCLPICSLPPMHCTAYEMEEEQAWLGLEGCILIPD